jgi:general secretion pathway protein N
MIRYGLVLALAAGIADTGRAEVRSSIENRPFIQAALDGITPPQGISAAPGIDDPLGGPADLGATKFDAFPAPGKPLSRQQAPVGNPLWAVPLSLLSVTRERPIFSPSRRPPPPVVVGTPYVAPAAPPPPPPAGPVRPQLALVGTVANETEGIGIFVDQATNKIVRLRLGEDHAGWILRAVRAREVVLQNDRQTEVLSFPPPGTANPTSAKAREPEL